MSTQIENPLADAVRAAYRNLPEKHRATFLKRVCPTCPKTTSYLLHAAHIPHSFQPERIAHWLRPEQQQKIDSVLLAPENENSFDNLLRGFFSEGHRAINDWFLSKVDAGAKLPLTFEDALTALPQQFPTDPFVDVYIKGIRWICRDEINSHEGIVLKERQQTTPGTKPVPSSSPASESLPPPADVKAGAVMLPEKLAQFDQGLQTVDDAIAALCNLQPCDCEALSTTIKAARKLATDMIGELIQLAAESGHPVPTWTTRDEFCAIWANFAVARAKDQTTREQCHHFKSSVGALLEGVVIRTRVPMRQPPLRDLAKRAAAEIRNSQLILADLPNAGSVQPADWLKWLFSHKDIEADELHGKLQPHLPELAKLTVDVNWEELDWPIAPPTLTQPIPSPIAATPVHAASVTVSSATVAPSPRSPATLPSTLLPPPPPSVHPVPTESKVPPAPSAEIQLVTPVAQSSNASQATPVAPDASQSPVPSEPAQPTLSPAKPTSTQVQPPTQSSATPAPSSQPVDSPLPKSQPPAVSPDKPDSVPVVPTLAPDQDETVHAIVWCLGRQERWGLASHILNIQKDHSLPRDWMFAAAALGPHVSYEISPLSERLTELFALSLHFSFESLPDTSRPAVRLLVAGAALRPALLTPQTGAASLLKLASVNRALRLPAFGSLIDAAAEFGLHRQALHPHMLSSAHNRADWERQFVGVREDIKAWIGKADKAHFNFAPALKIWLSWVGKKGVLIELLNRTANATVANSVELTNSWAKWSTAPADQVQSAMKAIGQWRAMDGAHRDKLISRLQEAIALANRALALLAQSPQAGSGDHEKKLLPLDVIRRNLPAAASELRKLADTADADMRAAATLCVGTLEGIAAIYSGTFPLPGGEEANPCWLVDAELLRDPSFGLNANGTIVPPIDGQWDRLLALAKTTPDWQAAWQKQLATENHNATGALLDFFRWQLPAGVDPVALSAQRDRELQACRRKLEDKAEATLRLLEESASLGFCRETDFSKRSHDVRAVMIGLSTAADLSPLGSELDNIRQAIQCERNQETARVRQRAVTVNLVPAVLNRITALLDAGDIHTATDYLDHATQGHALPDVTTTNNLFNAFFEESGWLRQAEVALRETRLSDCCLAASSGKIWNFLDFQLLGIDQRANAESHLKLWQHLERTRRASENDVLQLASALGLQPIKGSSRPVLVGPHAVHSYVVQTQLVEDRATAVVPTFGSDARGRYTLHLVWGEPRADELLSLCRRETGDTSAHIIVAFRVLNSLERRELAEIARKPERAFRGVVVDRALFTFACAQTAGRLSTLLHCALPFSCVEPYTVAAGEVAPEMFYGRGQELQSLADPRGSCFVYGGRQLGKTALLRALERQFHNLPQGRAAVFVDLKRELFSRGRPLDDLWSVLVNRLREVGVLDDIKVGAAAGQEALFRHIKDWLNAAPERRLLLLLDESDSFLEQDGKECDHYEPFPRCQRLKGLMEDTKHRFKVIFAGLHNVQRTTRCSNHPLAHFGDAICIGPMLGEAESRNARALVEQPMTAAGYTFESPDVVSRILALTNYYPSLIQLFCHHLLLDLRANHVVRFSNPRHTPPCIITSQHVQTVYGNTVRKRIQEKVRLTLDLDKRYELIAYLLAFYSMESSQDGVEFPEIRTEAAKYWPAGFVEMRTDDEFRSLLDEMVGLGILRSVQDSSRYALRNENVVSLLGTQEEILRQLDAAKSWEPALKYEADKFRRVLADKPKLLFSPLTAKQEGELKVAGNQVAILYGLPASGFGEVPAAMESVGLFTKSRTNILRNCFDPKTLSDRIAEVQRPPGTNTILIVPAELHWDETWIAAATHRLAQFTSKDAFLTVLLLAGPLRTIASLQGVDGAEEQGVRIFTLRPWHDAAVRQWLHDHEIQSDRAQRDRILQATGNWPLLLMRLNTSSAEELSRSCDDLTKSLNNPADLPALYSAFGFSKTTGDEPLRIAAELKKFTPQEVCEFYGAGDAATCLRINLCLKRAERFGLISRAATGFEFDPVAATILLNATQRP